MKKFFEVTDGHEIRGFQIRLYPDAATVLALQSLEADLRHVWNWLVHKTEEVIAVREAFAIKHGLVGPRPSKPSFDGLSSEESEALAKAYRSSVVEWSQAVHKATDKIPACSYRRLRDMVEQYGCKHDYQLFKRVLSWQDRERDIEPSAFLLQALARNFLQKSARRKRRRRHIDSMPIQTRSGVCFRLGDFGSRRGKPFYDCEVTINGLHIRGRLPGRSPLGRVLEGVSITRQADGWWASIKVEQPVRVLAPPTPGTVIGLDVGLDNIVAMSNGVRVPNERGRVFAERIAGRQAMKLDVGRLHQKAARHTKHVIYNQVVKPLAHAETIKVERLHSKIGQLGSKKTSVMRLIVSLLRERYGDRVREVDPSFTSQDCSQCGFRDKESWSYEHGRFGRCSRCGYSADRDVNAARNIAAKEAIAMGS